MGIVRAFSDGLAVLRAPAGHLAALFAQSLLIWLLICVGFHLNHAISSAFQTLGVNHPKYNPFIHGLSVTVAVVVTVGFLSVPGGVLMGLIQLPAGVML